MFLIRHVTSREHMFKGLVNLWMEASDGESPPCHIRWSLI